MKAAVAIVGAGVVGSATALALARRGVAVELLEAEAEPGMCASGTNSGIFHAGFDSHPGELETDLILRSAELRDELLAGLGVRVLRCGALMRPLGPDQREPVAELAENASRNGVEAGLGTDGSLEVPGESVTDPMAYTQGLAAAAVRHGAALRVGTRVESIAPAPGGGVVLSGGGGSEGHYRVVVNCAGLGADALAAPGGDPGFEVFPRKGEFLVFEQPPGERLERILLPVPEEGTKGVLVFPTVDGHVIAGPTAIDGTDKSDWSVRPEAAAEIVPKAARMFPALEGLEPIASYAGLRTAARDRSGAQVNYAIGPAPGCDGLINVAAIRSTGMTASLGIAELAVRHVGAAGVELEEPLPLLPPPEPSPPTDPWWRRAVAYRS